jgi:hypothetical protein
VTVEEWDLLQKRIALRRESPRGQAHSSLYMLSGIAKCGQCGGPMSGKLGAEYKGKRYRNYYCSRAMRAKEQCASYNGHSVTKLEGAVLEYLGRFSNAELVKQYLDAADREELMKLEAQLRDIEHRLADSESGFLKKLDDLLTRKVLNEAEFDKAKRAERDRNARLQAQRVDITKRLDAERDRTELAERLPQEIGSFLEAFETPDPRQQKAHLQSILKAAHIYNDGRIELVFRE